LVKRRKQDVDGRDKRGHDATGPAHRTKTTSPNSNGIVNTILGVIPRVDKGWLAGCGEGAPQRASFFSHANEVNEILDFGYPPVRQGLDLLN
jgi:hypothetical protein